MPLPLRPRLVLALVALQVAIPLAATIHRVPSKLGFHMFSGYELWQVEVADGQGQPLDVDPRDWLVVPREDVDWARHLPPHLCEDVPGAATVRVEQFGRERTVEC